jgi:hypothetical protein
MIKYNKYKIKPKFNNTITIVFENVECGYIPKSKCKFRVSKGYIKELEFNLSDIKYGSFYTPTQDRIIRYKDICSVEINYNRYWAKWNKIDGFGWFYENERQVNNITDEKVRITWSR